MIAHALSQLGLRLGQMVRLNKGDKTLSERILFKGCPICDCASSVDFIKGDCSKHPLYHDILNPIINWKQCADCMHIFTDGYYTEDSCRLIYGKSNADQRVGVDLENQRPLSSRIVEKILPYVYQGSWLDVGFGNGSLLFTAQEYGFVPVGLDVRADTVKAMAAFGIEAYTNDVTQFSSAFEFSVISMADVLEHMPYPKKGLEAAYRLLAKDGILFISLPNVESMVWKTLSSKNTNPYWGELEHYHNFGRSGLYRLLRESGFDPVRYGISERYRSCMEVIVKKR